MVVLMVLLKKEILELHIITNQVQRVHLLQHQMCLPMVVTL
uniref:Uncharacterized protein n=1 Tax=Rhizophora mucronata TaxID=61149 RepID=A0A2P2LLT0_RHIMU